VRSVRVFANGAIRPSFACCVASLDAFRLAGSLKPELRAALDKFVTENKVVLFMKGTKQFPQARACCSASRCATCGAHASSVGPLLLRPAQCGFSNTCVQVLNQCSVPYETVNILEDESLRTGLKEYSAWPTFPQLYIGGDFFGGCDITVAAFNDGSLKEKLEMAINS
jgi:monothiol glutaredoxin